ncbi:MAG: hypothetical protein KJ614_14770 [Gammaproteobacteria bacterium]|uniref:hypothetical protein n=1 Tax=Rhodoferax sp. TaxID=50421 RepID=UPI001DF4FCB3|nr:hypothetical protein [Rhodoferax sp.]MBU3900163.1 hypothetical protein [Gammaproteobacteria bacterium]MBU3996699.1 hypothetical protein [Gammaproteobacteria bacterium]MBU4082201.1 hypothetical protein [Gammaproteobacteria bacterium]
MGILKEKQHDGGGRLNKIVADRSTGAECAALALAVCEIGDFGKELAPFQQQEK